MVAREGLMLAGAGLGLGLAWALALSRRLGSPRCGSVPTDRRRWSPCTPCSRPWQLLARCDPARRGARVDPTGALAVDG
jgi:hypothetical protein